MDFEEELLKRNIGFCVYANLNDRKGVHGYSGSHSGYDRSKDNPDVSILFLSFSYNCKVA